MDVHEQQLMALKCAFEHCGGKEIKTELSQNSPNLINSATFTKTVNLNILIIFCLTIGHMIGHTAFCFILYSASQPIYASAALI